MFIYTFITKFIDLNQVFLTFDKKKLAVIIFLCYNINIVKKEVFMDENKEVYNLDLKLMKIEFLKNE